MGACLLQDGVITCAIEEERLSLVKHALPGSIRDLWPKYNRRFGYFPWASVCYCLNYAGMAIDDLDALVVPSFSTADFAHIVPIKEKKKIIIANEPDGADHHFAHALSAFFASPFDDAAVLVVDNNGSVLPGKGYEAESGYVFEGRSGAYRDVFKNRYLDLDNCGIGWMYDVVSAALGFVNTHIGYLADPGKTMGLAPYGKVADALSAPWIKVDGFALDLSGFNRWLLGLGIDKIARYDDRARALVQDEANIPPYAMDLAYKVQDELERAILSLCFELHKRTGKKNLCIAGGVGLNSVANGLISNKGPFENLSFQPASGDNGQAIGLAYYGHLKLAPAVRISPIKHAFGGRSYSDTEIESTLRAAGMTYQTLEDDQSLANDAAALIADGKTIGWFQGGSEYGPRALGHRSILADPRPATMKDHLNLRVKFREPFRPFAPSVLLERAREVFELKHESPYMLIVAPVRPEWRDRVQSITHVDGTARIQTVDRGVDGLYARLIDAFAVRTGVPLVLNTSFNLRGMPVVESPKDALRAFLFTELDALYLGRHKVSYPDLLLMKPTVSSAWRLTIDIEMNWQAAQMLSRGQFVRCDGSGRHVTIARLPKLRSSAIAPQDEVNVVGSLVFALDGETRVTDALEGVVDDHLDPDLRRSVALLMQALLREGILSLKFGSLEL
jgi:carbamoyltransferase